MKRSIRFSLYFCYTGDGSYPDSYILPRLVKKKGLRPDTIHTLDDGQLYAEVPPPTYVNAKYQIQETIVPLMRNCWAQEPDDRPEFTGTLHVAVNVRHVFA